MRMETAFPFYRVQFCPSNWNEFWTRNDSNPTRQTQPNNVLSITSFTTFSFCHRRHSFMLQHPVRSHGRALFSSPQPCARLNMSRLADSTLASSLGIAATASTALRIACRNCLPRNQWRSNRTKASGPATTVVKTGKKLKMDLLQTPNALSKALRATGIWDGRALNKALAEESKEPKKKGRPKKGTVKAAEPEKKESPIRKRAAKGDKSRVQITNESLVKDMIEYLNPTLERHKGCDLVSVYPGAGAWTKALHDAVQPRSHLLLEPDESTYQPFLQPLLDQDNVRLVPKSGIVWEDLDAVLTPEYLPNQVEIDPRALPDGPPRNDTLLVSMNLAMFPKKKFASFQSISRMVVFQLLQTIRTSTVYQKYGQVRMLIWIPDDEKSGPLPRVLGGRRRLALEGELTTEYIAEVCGRDVAAEDDKSMAKKGSVQEGKNQHRWPQMDLESARMCKLKMQERGMVTPPGRETSVMKAMEAYVAAHPAAMKQGISLWTMLAAVGAKGVANEAEYRALREQHEKTPFAAADPNFVRLKGLEQYFVNLATAFERAVEFIQQQDGIVDAYQAAMAAARATDPSSAAAAADLLAKAQQLEADFDAFITSLPKYRKEYAFMARDGVHALTRQPHDLGPIMTWDRRPYEPLPAAAADFFPNVPCALLDVQPKATHPLLRSMGPGTDNAGDIFDMILGVMTDGMTNTVARQVGTLWPGVEDGVLPRCGSLVDPARGGIPLKGAGAIANRCLNVEQMTEILEEFMKWPFRPSHAELVGRLNNDEYNDDDAELYVKGNASWQSP